MAGKSAIFVIVTVVIAVIAIVSAFVARSFIPEARGGETPFHAGRDTGSGGPVVVADGPAPRKTVAKKGSTAQDSGVPPVMVDGVSLFKSAWRDDPARMKLFLDGGVNPGVREDYYPFYPTRKGGWTALHLAAFRGDRRSCAFLLGRGALVNADDGKGLTPLHWAAFSGSREWADFDPMLEAFLYYDEDDSRSWGVDPNGLLYKTFEIGGTVLPAVESTAHLDACSFLLEKGADIAARDEFGQTPLHIAAYVGNAPLVEFFLRKGAGTGVADARGRTPLHLAARGGHEKVVGLLLSAGAGVNRRDGNGRAPLHLAAFTRGDHEGTIRLLLSRGADPNALDDRGQSPLFLAARPGIARLLIGAGARVTVRDRDGRTVLHRMALGSRRLRDEKTPRRDGDFGMEAPLVWEPAEQEEMLDLLLSKGLGVNDRDRYGATPLHYAAGWSSEETVKALLERGADVRAGDCEGKTPLHFMAERYDHQYSLVSAGGPGLREAGNQTGEVLLKAGGDVNSRDGQGATSLDYATWMDQEDLVPFFARSGGRRSAALPTEAEGLAKDGPLESLRELLDSKPSLLRSRGNGGATLLHMAAKSGKTAICRLLIDRGAEVDRPDARGATPLFEAVWAKHRGVMELLLEKGADINVRERRTYLTPLTCAFENREALGLLISKGKACNPVFENYGGGPTLLHRLTEWGDCELAGLVLQRGADVNVRDEHGATPLHYAAWCGAKENDGNRKMIGFLVSRGADVNARDEDGRTPLHGADKRGNGGHSFPGTAEELLAAGADARATDNQGLTPLHLTREADTARLLLDGGASPRARAKDGSTPLHCAASDEIVRLLVSRGADVRAKNGKGETPLFHAAAMGQRDGVVLLVSKGSDVHARDSFGDTPLHVAAWNGHIQLAQILLAKGADINARDGLGRTPMGLARKGGREALREVLRKHGGKE